jgi:methylglutamate dehydrogenase subunit D
MLERVSAFGDVQALERVGIRFAEAPDFVLTQVAGEPKALKTAFPKQPDAVGVAVDYAGKVIMRIGPNHLWIIGTPPEPHDGLFLTPLSSSRSRIMLEGSNVRAVLAKCAAIDFHDKTFTSGKFVMTGIHHMPVLIHCVEPDNFHVYGLRTFALSLWEVLVDAGHS